MNEGKGRSADSDLLWGCFINWVETLEKVEEAGRKISVGVESL